MAEDNQGRADEIRKNGEFGILAQVYSACLVNWTSVEITSPSTQIFESDGVE